MRRQRRSQQGGFTLVEVLVSLVLSAIAMIGVIALYRAQSNASSFSRRTTEATVLAEDKLERWRSSAISAACGITPCVTAETTLDETGLSVAGGPFTRTSTISGVAFGTESLWHLKVQVQWTDDGITRQVTVNGRRKQ